MKREMGLKGKRRQGASRLEASGQGLHHGSEKTYEPTPWVFRAKLPGLNLRTRRKVPPSWPSTVR